MGRKTQFKVKAQLLEAMKGGPEFSKYGLFQKPKFLLPNTYAPKLSLLNDGAHRGLQMLTTCPRSRRGLQDCYIDKAPYQRLFEGEAYTNTLKIELQNRIAAKKKNITTQEFLPPSSTGKQLFGKTEAFSPTQKPKSPAKRLPRNILTSVAKKGNSGYADICINRYPEYLPDSYERGEMEERAWRAKHKARMIGQAFVSTSFGNTCFDKNPFSPVSGWESKSLYRSAPPRMPAEKPFVPPSFPKEIGGNKDGCFNKFPEHKGTLPDSPRDTTAETGVKKMIPFLPTGKSKDTNIKSTIGYPMSYRIHNKNWIKFNSFYFGDDNMTPVEPVC